MTNRRDMAWQVGRLLHWALRNQARPAQEPEYRRLVDTYLDDVEFRDALRATADGLGLDILDVSDHGVILTPHGDSVFFLKPADFRPGTSRADERLLDGLAQIAIATTIFPRARDLDDDVDRARPPVTVDEVEGQLRTIADSLADEARGAPDPEAEDEERGLIEAWRVYRRLQPITDTKDSRKGRRTTRRAIEKGFERLRDFGCFTQVKRGDSIAWQPTRRYQVMVQKLAATRVFEMTRESLERSEQRRV